MMKNFLKRLKQLSKDQEIASKSNIKLKLSPRIKFFGFHFYRRILMGLEIDRDDLLGDKQWKGTIRPKGEYTVTWGEWKHKIKKICPIQYYFRQQFDIDLWRWLKIRQIQDGWYYLKCKYFHPYNVLKIKSLPPTWVDEDTLLVHSMFEVLRRFMEQKPNERHDYSWPYTSKDECGMTFEEWEKYAEPHRLFWKEISDVWEWWKDCQFVQNEMDKLLSGKKTSYNYDALVQMDKELKEREDWALQTLIKHRHGLWV